MSDPEGSRRYGEPKPVLPTLIAPTVAEFETIKQDYEYNPDLFKLAMQFRMGLDNPELVGFMQQHPRLPDSDLSYKWAHIYYGMFELASLRKNVPMLRVHPSIVEQYARTQIPLFNSG